MKPNSISNRKLTLLRKLNQKKYRRQEQLFFVEGARAVQQVFENEQMPIKELFFDNAQDLWRREEWKKLAGQFSISTVNEIDFEAISDTENPQGVIALCQMPQQIDLEILAQEEGIILATDGIQDPGNMGTMIRTSAWFGVKGLLTGKGTVGLFHPKVVRSTAGAIGSLPYRKVDLNKTLPFFEKAGWQVVLLDVSDESEDIRNFTKTDRMIIIAGNEGNGISRDLFIAGRSSIHIPLKMHKADAESLNVSIALAIALFEFS